MRCCFGGGTKDNIDVVVKAPQNGQSSPSKPAAKEGVEQTTATGDTSPSPLYAGQQQAQTKPATSAPAASTGQQQSATATSSTAQQQGSQPAVNQSLRSLSANEANAVQATLLKVRACDFVETDLCLPRCQLTVASLILQVSTLIQKFAEGRSERTTPVQAVRRALNLVTADCRAKYARYVELFR